MRCVSVQVVVEPGGETTWLKRESVSHSVVSLVGTPWTVARQAPLSMGFPRQEYWSGLPFSSPGNLPTSGIEPASPALAGELCTVIGLYYFS